MFPEQVVLPTVVVGDWAGMRLRVVRTYDEARSLLCLATLALRLLPCHRDAINGDVSQSHRIGMVEMICDKGDVLWEAILVTPLVCRMPKRI